MRTSIKLAVTALVAATMLGSLAAVAVAGRLLVSEQTFRIVWRELEFEAKESQAIRPGRIICSVTMEGSFHGGTITKTSPEPIGDVTRAIVAHPCLINRAEYWIWNGRERLPTGETTTNSLPWPLYYEGYTGMLPNINAINMRIDRRIKMTVQYNNFSCGATYGTNADGEGDTLATRGAGGEITRFEPVSIFLLKQSGVFTCPTLARLIGASTTITGLNNTSRLTITLI